MDLSNREGVLAELTPVFRKVFDNDEITPCERMSAKDVDEWDSIAHVHLMMEIERRFKVRMSAAEIGGLKDVGDLVSLIQRKAK